MVPPLNTGTICSPRLVLLYILHQRSTLATNIRKQQRYINLFHLEKVRICGELELYFILCLLEISHSTIKSTLTKFIFNSFSIGKLLEKVSNASYDRSSQEWMNLSDEAKDLIEKLMCVDPHERLNAEEALGHPWLSKM